MTIFIPKTRSDLILRHDQLMIDLVEQFVPCVVTQLEPISTVDFILLYGSHARGNYHWLSDVDIIICSNAFEGVRIVDRSTVLFRCQLSIPLEIICYTPPEAMEALARRSTTILEGLEEGIPLYKQGALLEHLTRSFKELKAAGTILRLRNLGSIRWKIMY